MCVTDEQAHAAMEAYYAAWNKWAIYRSAWKHYNASQDQEGGNG